MWNLYIMFKYYGLDHYYVLLNEIAFLKKFKTLDIYCYNVKSDTQKTYFCCRVKDRKKVNKYVEEATYLYTSGILGMLLRNITNMYRLMSYTVCIFMWMFLSNTVFKIDVIGEVDAMDKKMYSILDSFLYKQKQIDKMKDNIQNTFENELAWFEVYEKGNVVEVNYTLKNKINPTLHKQELLIAKQDGLIAYFKDVSGYKNKNINDLVKKGDIIVSNKLLNPNNQEVNIDVKGKVFAYTWKRIEVEIDNNKYPDAINYFNLLLEARSSIELEKEEFIEKENVLLFDKNKGKIRIIILYTLLEDITS